MPESIRFDSSDESDEEDFAALKQYASSDKVNFVAVSHTVPQLPAGFYELEYNPQRQILYRRLCLKTEGLIRFANTPADEALNEIQYFWENRARFERYGLAYRRGLLFHGPAGTGKSSCIQLLMHDVIARNGVVFKYTYPDVVHLGIRQFRQIQPDTPLIVLMEDLDAILERYDDSAVLNFLDGAEAVENTLVLATTNYPEHLKERITNRPGRFDRCYLIPNPDSDSRRLYFESRLHPDDREDFEMTRWVEDTADFSVSHLKELFTRVMVFGHSYDESLQTIRSMIGRQPDSRDGVRGDMGFKRFDNY